MNTAISSFLKSPIQLPVKRDDEATVAIVALEKARRGGAYDEAIVDILLEAFQKGKAWAADLLVKEYENIDQNTIDGFIKGLISLHKKASSNKLLYDTLMEVFDKSIKNENRATAIQAKMIQGLGQINSKRAFELGLEHLTKWSWSQEQYGEKFYELLYKPFINNEDWACYVLIYALVDTKIEVYIEGIKHFLMKDCDESSQKKVETGLFIIFCSFIWQNGFGSKITDFSRAKMIYIFTYALLYFGACKNIEDMLILILEFLNKNNNESSVVKRAATEGLTYIRNNTNLAKY